MRQALAVVALLTLALAAPASAQFTTTVPARPSGPEAPLVAAPAQEYGTAGGLSIEVSTHWPKSLSKGYFPITVRIENRGKEADFVTLEVERRGFDWNTSYETRAALKIGALETREVELLSPAFEVRDMGPVPSSRWASVILRSSKSGEAFHASVTLEATTFGTWPILLTGGERSVGEDDMRAVAEALVASIDAAHPGEELGGSVERRASARRPRPQVAGLASERLPQRLESYTSLAAVLVDVASPPTERELEPAFAWARLGGTVAFMGPGALDVARDYGSVQPWLEPRFRQPTDGPGSWGGTDAPGAWRMGLGNVLVLESEGLAAELDGEVLRLTLEELESSEPRADGSRWFGLPEIPGLGKLPFRAFALLMVVFAVLVGPVNFIVLKRLNRNGLLLLTIPGLAGIVALVFLAYGTFHQGVDVKRAQHSLTVLDQREHRASSVAARRVFAGFAPGGGLRPAPGTAVLPLQGSNNRAGLFMMQLGEETALSADYMPARRTVGQVVLSDRAARLRIDLRPEENGFAVENDLTETIEELVYRAADGGWYGPVGPLAPGERALLEAAEDTVCIPILNAAWSRALWPQDADVPPGSYLARVGQNPFVDDCGLGSVEYSGWHVIVGIPDEEESR